MPVGKKIAIALILLLVTITLLRETGLLNIDYYKMNSKSNSSSSWEDKGFKTTFDLSMLGMRFGNEQFSDLSIVVIHGNDTLYKDTVKNTQIEDTMSSTYIIINIDTLDNGFLWTPLYKSSAFTAAATSTYMHQIVKTPSATKTELVIANLIGHLNINGDVSISGLCSHRRATELIKELVVKSFISETKQYFSTLD